MNQRITPQLPLENIRVLDLGQVYAGPLAGRILADLGAEVIRVESQVRSTRGGPDPQAGATYPDTDPGERPYNRSAYYNELHRNKLAISLDLSKQEGQQIFKRLVTISDVVLENFTPRVMSNFELDFPVLASINPRLIMVSISAYGQTGPYHDYLSFGRGIEAMAGLTQMTGYADDEPIGPGTAYADATGGLHAAFSVLVAIRHLKHTGKGQHIDLSLQESLLGLLGEKLLDYSMNNRKITCMGNQDSPLAFQGVYQCKGTDQWIAITIRSQPEWDRMMGMISGTDKIADITLTDILAGKANRQGIDRQIGSWTIDLEPYSVMAMLQKCGIAAGAVLGADDICRNVHLKERGFFEIVSHPETGTHPHPGIGWKSKYLQKVIRHPAPCFAQHNNYVFGDLLGMSAEEISQLEESGVTGTVPRR